MSQENVELVRAAWAAWERGDMEAIFAFYDPAIVWDQTHYEAAELSDVYHGHDGIKQFFRQWLAPFESYHAHAEDFIDAGEAVVVRIRQGGRGKGSGAEVEMPPYCRSTDFGMVGRCGSRSTASRLKPSKPWGCRSKTLTPTPEPRPLAPSSCDGRAHTSPGRCPAQTHRLPLTSGRCGRPRSRHGVSVARAPQAPARGTARMGSCISTG